MDNKLNAWKARTLSLVGRVTLATAVLNAIPNYAIIHLLDWDTICKPKDQGGLGLRSARCLNLAYLVKLA
ncbi:unnamed protein product [Linum trigynum]|uniref:Uncharacterized protein n=1 Tax=Linum trigynum TaxID=586398 RepID=A0AAV2GRR8_9ROSI